MIRLLILLALIFLTPSDLIAAHELHAPLPAQASAIACGETVTATVQDSAGVFAYAFDGQTAQNVRVTMRRTSGDMTNSVHLYRATDLDKSLIMQTGVNLRDPSVFEDPQHTAMVFFTLPADDTYLIRAGRNGWWYNSETGSGEFTLTLECDADFGVQTHGGALNCGQSAADWVYGSNNVDQWVFEGTAGQNVRVTMRRVSGDVVNSLHLYSADDLDRALVDHEGVNLRDPSVFEDPQHTAVVFFTLPADGTYVIRAGRNGWWYNSETGSGEYALTLECEADFGVQTHGGTLTCGMDVTDWIHGTNRVDQWVFEGSAGQNVRASLRRISGDMASMLHLYDAADLDTALIESAGVNLRDPSVFEDPEHTAVVFFTLPVDGTYVIRAGRDGWWYSSDNGSGDYVLTLECDADFGSQTHGGALACGETVADWIYGSNRVDAWRLEGTDGQALTLTMNRLTGDLPAWLGIYASADLNNAVVAGEGADSAGNHSVELTLTLPADDVYLIRAGRDGWWYSSNSGSGDYTLSLTCEG
ncbi:MAG: hypothetical protein JNL42_06295 [Anaerolineae bacterium]|nr:hypothetical protein [Anaerolineae bacterium]